MNGMGERDELLMLAVRDGDVPKLGLLFDRHHRVLFDYFARMTGDRAAAEDLVQDVFFRMLKYRKTYRDDSRFTAWMFHIARNARIDHHKKRRGEVMFPEEGMEVPSRSPFPNQELEQQQETVLLQRALFKLSEEKREVLVLSELEQMTVPEIAGALGANLNTTYSRLKAAKKAFGEVYAREMARASRREPA